METIQGPSYLIHKERSRKKYPPLIFDTHSKHGNCSCTSAISCWRHGQGNYLKISQPSAAGATVRGTTSRSVSHQLLVPRSGELPQDQSAISCWCHGQGNQVRGTNSRSVSHQLLVPRSGELTSRSVSHQLLVPRSGELPQDQSAISCWCHGQGNLPQDQSAISCWCHGQGNYLKISQPSAAGATVRGTTSRSVSHQKTRNSHELQLLTALKIQ